jgi:general secretion pathway protein D
MGGYGGMGGMGGGGYGGMGGAYGGYGGYQNGLNPFASMMGGTSAVQTGTQAGATAGSSPDQTGTYLGAPAREFPIHRGPRIIPNPFDNTLLVQSTPEEWEQISRLLLQLDVPPRQILVEAKIIEVDSDRQPPVRRAILPASQGRGAPQRYHRGRHKPAAFSGTALAVPG